MRLNVLAYFYPPVVAGGEVILQQSCRALVCRGHQVTVHVSDFGDLALSGRVVAPARELDEGVRVHRHRAMRLPDPNLLEKSCLVPAFAAMVRQPCDLLVVHGYPSQQLALAARQSRPFTVQNYLTGADVAALAAPGSPRRRLRSGLWRRRTAPALGRAAAVLADTAAAAAGLRSLYGLDNVVLHPGSMVDASELDGATDEGTQRRELGLPADAVLVLAPSRVAPMKGLDRLVAAMEYLPENWCLVAAGPVEDADYFRTVSQAARPLGARFRHLELKRGPFLALLQAADVVVLPSRGEASGGVVMEALAAGVPSVVSTAVENARDLYGGQAQLWSDDGPQSLAAALQAARCRPSGHWESARVWMRERFSVSVSVDRLEAIYLAAAARQDVRSAGWS